MSINTNHTALLFKAKPGTLFLMVIFFNFCVLQAQELEPRMLSNVPIGTNFLGLAYSYGSGNMLLDPALPIENLQAKINTATFSYVKSFNLFGKSAKINVKLPWAYGTWDGYLEGADTTTWRMGLADPRFLVSVNLIGAPALNTSDYKQYKQKTIVGVSLLILDPLGTYYSDKLINLSSNRWTCRPQIGVSHKTGKWFYEAYLGLWIFGHNPNFYNGNRLTQKPLFTWKLHAIRSFKNNIWIGLGAGYGYGGQTAVNNVPRNFHISTLRFGALVSIPITEKHSIKLRYDTGKAIKKGPDFDSASIVYVYRWGKKEAKETKTIESNDFYSSN